MTNKKGKDNLGDRIKQYENAYSFRMIRRTPYIIRLDGKAFHSYTKNFQKPFSQEITDAFQYSAEFLFREISGAKLIFAQSDEISILVTDYDSEKTEPWVNKNIQKTVSISASILTATFNDYIFRNYQDKKLAFFDARTFILPRHEVINYFIWRQQDCIRNSISSLAQSFFSAKRLHKKNTEDMKKMMLEEIDTDWNFLEPYKRNGYCQFRESISTAEGIRTIIKKDLELPLFVEDKNYINKFVYLNE